jgi:hypothetical protein
MMHSIFFSMAAFSWGWEYHDERGLELMDVNRASKGFLAVAPPF